VGVSRQEHKKARQEETSEVETVEDGKEQAMDVCPIEEPLKRDERATRLSKVVKVDDADIPTYLWDECILLGVDTEVSDKEGVAL
jgi:hypothetical protein